MCAPLVSKQTTRPCLKAAVVTRVLLNELGLILLVFACMLFEEAGMKGMIS